MKAVGGDDVEQLVRVEVGELRLKVMMYGNLRGRELANCMPMARSVCSGTAVRNTFRLLGRLAVLDKPNRGALVDRSPDTEEWSEVVIATPCPPRVSGEPTLSHF